MLALPLSFYFLGIYSLPVYCLPFLLSAILISASTGEELFEKRVLSESWKLFNVNIESRDSVNFISHKIKLMDVFLASVSASLCPPAAHLHYVGNALVVF